MTQFTMYEKELNQAISAVKKSEKTFRKYFGSKNNIKKKNNNPKDLVSPADLIIEKAIKKELAKKFPEYGFIGEETKNIKPDSKYAWILDPIDGTSNYIQGMPDCVISLALLENRKPILGVVYAPMLGMLFTASKNGSAKLNGKKINTSKTAKLNAAFTCFGWGHSLKKIPKLYASLMLKVRKFRIQGTTALSICYTAAGIFDFYIVKKVNFWDYAAAQAILEAAGGIIEFDKKNNLMIAGNKKLTKKLQKNI